MQAYREEARKVTVSNGQRQVGESLRRLGISHELEYTTADGLFSIDLAITGRRIALEFDGPSHFITTRSSHSATPPARSAAISDGVARCFHSFL